LEVVQQLFYLISKQHNWLTTEKADFARFILELTIRKHHPRFRRVDIIDYSFFLDLALGPQAHDSCPIGSVDCGEKLAVRDAPCIAGPSFVFTPLLDCRAHNEGEQGQEATAKKGEQLLHGTAFVPLIGHYDTPAWEGA